MTKVQQTAMYGVVFVAGIIVFLMGCFGVLNGYWSGLGMAFACMAGVRLVQAWRYHHDPTYARRVEAVNTDERIAFVANKAADLTFRTSVLVLFALSVVMRVLNHGVVADTLALTAALQTLAYWVTYTIMSQKY